jgi:Uma2 family endonuclease
MATVIHEPKSGEKATPAVAANGFGMVTVIHEDDQVSVPLWVTDLESFCRWQDSDEFPESGRIWYLKGEVWVDMSKEGVFTHNLLKSEFFIVLGGLVRTERLGRFYPDGLFLKNAAGDIAGNPDATFASTAALRAKRVRSLCGKQDGVVGVEGSPDMVLEVVSPSSVRKDTVILRQAYWEAGVREYWLVDARREPLTFDILRHTAKGYVPTRKQGGWLKSAVFGKSFRLTQRVDEFGDPAFTLEVR